MRRQKNSKACYRILNVLLILILSLAITQTLNVAHAQNNTSNNQWAMSLTAENNKNNVTTTFAPFDQIQLLATVTYGNASQPDILVYFNVTGPQNSNSQTAITRIETTNTTGEAGFSFRLPIASENESLLVGTWQAIATIQTTNGIIQKSLNFTAQWDLETTAINLANSQGQNDTVFSPSDFVSINATINNPGQAQTANVTFSLQDSTGQIINQTEIQNSQIANSNQTQLSTILQIPDNATAGQAEISVAINSGTYAGINIPMAENQTATFTIASSDGTTNPTPTPTSSSTPTPSSSSTPTSGPTPTPNSVENTVSLFSWLLIATGIFTFTILTLFLRRNHSTNTDETPTTQSSTASTLNPETSTPENGQSATPVLISSTVPQETTQQPALQLNAPTPKIAQEKVMEATIMSKTNLKEIMEPQSKFAATIEVGKPDLEPASAQEPTADETLAHLNRVSSAAKRIHAIKTALKSKREQLAQDLIELNKLVDERENT